MSAIFLLKKELPKNHKVFNVLKSRDFVMGGAVDAECQCVLRDFCGLSKKCGFATFSKI